MVADSARADVAVMLPPPPADEDALEALDVLAWDFLGEHETVFGETTITHRRVAATACTFDDLVRFARAAYEMGKATVPAGVR